MATFTILEPMSTGDVIDRAVRIYRRNFTPLVSIVAVPSLIGYIGGMIFWYGYTTLLTSAQGSGRFPVSSIWMLIVGGASYPISAFVLLLTWSGLSRAVGDNLMLGEPITFRACVAAIRRRFGAITLMALLSVAILFGAYLILSIALFILFMVVGLLIGVIAAAQLPQWVTTVVLIILALVAVAAGVFLICSVVARVIFLPQIVMIEGESAGNALGRAIRLGKGNWHRVGAIVLFTYFVSISLLSAFTLPVLLGLYMSGTLNAEFFVSPSWSILSTSFRDIANLLSLPIWIVSFTLLYFDSRVRKEAYDIDLLAREINPGFYWQPPVQTSAFGYQMPARPTGGRSFVQTSPLGLAGYNPARPQANTASQGVSAEPPLSEAEVMRERFERAAENLRSSGHSDLADAVEKAAQQASTCKVCGAQLISGARFCMNCGSAT